MSSHGKGLRTKILVGSTTRGIAIHANRSLMVIRTPVKQETKERAGVFIMENGSIPYPSFIGFQGKGSIPGTFPVALTCSFSGCVQLFP